MKRRIVKIDKEKCNGCGACAAACHEGAIEMINGKAVLTREDYCDGLGDCLPVCPVDAISFEEREALQYNEAAVKANKHCDGATCPGTRPRNWVRDEEKEVRSASVSRLSQWPVQLKLVPVNAPYFDGANLLIAADCTAFSYGNFHEDFMKKHITLIGCPKLDGVDYSEKLAYIIKHNNIKSIKVARMEVPCCGGIEAAVRNALKASGKIIPWQVTVISTDGKILE